MISYSGTLRKLHPGRYIQVYWLRKSKAGMRVEYSLSNGPLDPASETRIALFSDKTTIISDERK